MTKGCLDKQFYPGIINKCTKGNILDIHWFGLEDSSMQKQVYVVVV